MSSPGSVPRPVIQSSFGPQPVEPLNYSYTPFDQIKVTTYTLVLTLDSPINISTAFWFLPVQKFQTDHDKFIKSIDTRYKVKIEKIRNDVKTVEYKKQKKLPLPHLSEGQIVSARYETLGRGSIKIYDSFKNVITVDISTETKNLNIKLCKEKIQITGAKSVEQGLHATELLLNHLRQIQQLPIDHTIMEFSSTLEELLKEVQPVDPIHETLTQSQIDTIYSSLKDISPYLVPILLNWLEIETIENIRHFSTAMTQLANSYNEYHIMDLNNKVKSTDIVMANCNYNLGFKINRTEFSKQLHGVNNMITHYDNMSQRSVKIERFYERPNSNIRPKAKKPHHTLTVYMSGIVTQSGPGGPLMKEMYDTFRSAVQRFEHQIRKE